MKPRESYDDLSFIEQSETERLKEEIIKIQQENFKLRELLKDVPEKKYIHGSEMDVNELFRLIVEMANSIIIHWDANGIFKYVNDYTLHFFGYTREEMIGKNAMMIVPEKEMSGRDLSNIVEDILKNPGKFIKFENENVKKNGEHAWIIWTNRAITDQKGNVTEIIAVGNDITDRKRAEEALEKQNIELRIAKERAEESDRLKSSFLANLRHEIRTPMNGILGFTELLRTPELSTDTQKSYLDAIRSNGTRMLDIINSLIDIAQIETGKIELKTEPVDICFLLDELFFCFEPQANKKGITLKCIRKLPENKIIINTDRTKLLQILTHLLKNAIRFTSEGCIEFGCKFKRDGSHLFYVKDTGIGIKKEYQKKIFHRFSQGDATASGIQEGIGLGLAISKAYVEQLGGCIKVRSEYTKGSVFFFSIHFETTTAILSAKKPELINKEPVIPNILIAEDDEMIYFFLKEVLRLNNINSFYARDGIEAIEAIKNNPEINLVLMDMRMSRMDGLEATKQIKIAYPKIPIIIQSAFFSDEDVQKAYGAGCDDFIAKPIEKNVLLKKIETLTGQNTGISQKLQ